MAKRNLRKAFRWLWYTLGGSLLLALIWAVILLNQMMPIITGYPAKFLCSAVFVSNRDAAQVEAIDLNFSVIAYVHNEVNYEEKSVTSHFLWGKSKAIYREGFGSTLINGVDEEELRAIKFPSTIKAPYNPDTLAWPMGNVLPDTNAGADRRALQEITDRLIKEKAYKGTAYAFLVLHKGVPVAEAYLEGCNAKTRFLGWSMGKSVTNALSGIMVKEGMWDIHQPVRLAPWQKDERKRITINNLLQMQSGLQWNEDYGGKSDVNLMLHREYDFGRFAFEKKLEFSPGTYWKYSSGSTNIVNYLMRREFESDSAYYSFAPCNLFHRIGMANALFEPDASGTLVGSSYIYATARDYARFGMLYLQDGVFNGEQILPKGWVKYTIIPPENTKKGYGSSFWLNLSGSFPSAPKDMYFCSGHDGQVIFIIPSRKMVMVVLGYSPSPNGKMNFDKLLGDVLKALEK